MKSFLFPDVNVWLALTHDRHVHHAAAAKWFRNCDGSLFFCRLTQLGLLRLLTTEQVMQADVLTQAKAWKAYHRWREEGRVEFHPEPAAEDFEKLFERFSAHVRPSPKVWADAYLAAFSVTAGLTLVTFDAALQKLAGNDTMLLRPGNLK